MLVSTDGVIHPTEDFICNKYEWGMIYWTGLLFYKGEKAGAPSFDKLAKKFAESKAVPFEQLLGSFTCIIVENDGRIIVFADNSNLHCVYHCSEGISSSFLDLAAYCQDEKSSDYHFDAKAVCEYLTLGKIYFGKTFVKGISILHNRYYIQVLHGAITVVDKKIGDIDSVANSVSHEEYFRMLSHALNSEKICQALTGGYDSRLIFARLKNELHCSPFFATNKPESKESKCAKEVCRVSGCNLTIVKTNKPSYSDSLLEELVVSGDGMMPLDPESEIRIATMKSTMRQAEFSVHLTGDGGVLHKDWEWIQDFPFYRRKRTNLSKFYDQRIAFNCKPNKLGPRLSPIYASQKKRFLSEMQPYVKRTNTESYDCLYYNLTGNRTAFYNVNIPGLVSYAPLNELQLVRYSYSLPRIDRFFFNTIRRLTTNADKRIARVKTNYGTTASSEPLYLCIDVVFQLADYMERAARLVSRKFLKKNAFVTSEIDWSLEQDIRDSRMVDSAIEYAKRFELLEKDACVDDFRYCDLLRIIHVYCLSELCCASWE